MINLMHRMMIKITPIMMMLVMKMCMIICNGKMSYKKSNRDS